MRFNIDDYKGKYVMHCKTEEEAKDFCNYLHSIGRCWCNGDSYNEVTEYDVYKENTAYSFNDDHYARINWYRNKNYTILEWSDFMNKEFTKADLKTGDVIKRRNGGVEIVNRELEMLIIKSGWNDMNDIRSNLTSTTNEDWDVVAVRRPVSKGDCQFHAFDNNWGTLVYERKEVEEMTLSEVCRLLGKEIKIVK